MRRTLFLVAGFLAALAGLFTVWNRWQRGWGATREEIDREMPGDELVPGPFLVTNRAITVNAPPDCIYPWLLQMGYRRGGLYSYDFLDRLFGILDEPSAREIHPEWQDLRVGDVVEVKKGPPFPVAILEPNSAFVLANPEVGWTWQTCMYAQPDGTTRLVTRNRSSWTGKGAKPAMLALDVPAFMMVRRWLQVLKQRAESLRDERELQAAATFEASEGLPVEEVAVSS